MAHDDPPHLSHEQTSWVRERHGSHVARLFFSDLNVDALHDGMRYMVFKRTGVTISRQSTHDLVVTMRSVFLTHARNLPEDVVGQVRELNAIVLQFCVRRIVDELAARGGYLRAATQPGYADAVLPPAVNTSVKGDRSLEMSLRV